MVISKLICLNEWTASNILILVLICLSILFQVIVMIFLVYLKLSDEFYGTNLKRNKLTIAFNYTNTILVFFIVVINIFVDILRNTNINSYDFLLKDKMKNDNINFTINNLLN